MDNLQSIISKFYILISFSLLAFASVSCQQRGGSNADNTINVKEMAGPPDWSKSASIYEVNIRQYTPEGTFKAFEEHLPRLQELGVDILWLMPVHPIGEVKRKGGLGSYYSVKDYQTVNPEFGSLNDLKSLVRKAHEMGFHVILDWVANHTAWDHKWIKEHPDWYTHDSLGEIVYPFEWTDVADLNYNNKAVWEAMINAMKYWVAEADIDGYRCDVADKVPTEFWEKARIELDRIKPVFMLAEAEVAEHHNMAFDMSYAWELHSIFNKIARGEKNANDLEDYFVRQDSVFPASAYRMTFITNHDENSWTGTVKERMGPAANAFAVLSFTLPGMPLIYSGQEAGMKKRLEFFEKDEIDWSGLPQKMEFYAMLNILKEDSPVLWNGSYGGKMERIETSKSESVFAFLRTKKNEDPVLIITNLSGKNFNVSMKGSSHLGKWKELFSGASTVFSESSSIGLSPWSYRVYFGSK